jgi:hypothetical protein
MQPVTKREATEDMSIIQRDILQKTGQTPAEDFEEVEDWALEA